MVIIKNIFLICIILFSSCSSIQIKEWWISPDGYYDLSELEPIPVRVEFLRFAGERKYNFRLDMHLKKQYKSIYFKELSLVHDNKKWYLIKDETMDFGYLHEYKPNTEDSHYSPWDWKHPPWTFKHRKIFRNMKNGDIIKVRFVQMYSLDSEPLQRQTFTVEVHCYKRGIETPSFMLLP
jgi:hypothetical protein